MANSRQRKKATAAAKEAVPPEAAPPTPADASHPATPPTVEAPAPTPSRDRLQESLESPSEAAATPRRRIRLITTPPVVPTVPQTMMGRAIQPFAKPAQSGTFAPFAVAQARRGR